MKQHIQHINGLFRARRFVDACEACSVLTAEKPERFESWFLSAKAKQALSDFDGMLEAAQTAITIEPENLTIKFLLIDAFIHVGEVQEARSALLGLAKTAEDNAKLWAKISELYTACGDHKQAYSCAQKALVVEPNDGALMYNAAATAVSVGEIEEAEALFDRVISHNLHDYDAYYNRAVLRKQTVENNHTDAMLHILKKGVKNAAGAVQLNYALAKEFEDLGINSTAFRYLREGADKRRASLTYDVLADIKAMASISKHMDANFCTKTPTASDDPGPIFIVGLPRTGTTLVDRILASHSAVESLGEINDFALALMRVAGGSSGKTDLIARAASLDFGTIGKLYQKGVSERSSGAAYLLDKTPANFLYLGLIANALPQAKIIHLRRGAMDSCYAIYKTLFRMGYPYSYDLEDLGRYYIAYHSLMAHWRSHLPGRFIDIDYESLVQNQEMETKRLLAHCGLGFEANCLAFHKNTAPTATASAAQVREPIHTGSIGKWHNYESELAPLKAILETGGIPLDMQGEAT